MLHTRVLYIQKDRNAPPIEALLHGRQVNREEWSAAVEVSDSLTRTVNADDFEAHADALLTYPGSNKPIATEHNHLGGPSFRLCKKKHQATPDKHKKMRVCIVQGFHIHREAKYISRLPDEGHVQRT